MGYDYDKLYADTRNALGAPTSDFVTFFENYGKGGASVLDIGCGQGRDALFIARAGHHVTGVDLSAHGVRDMLDAALAEELSITGIVADITAFQPTGDFDIVLCDRTLHMLTPEDRWSVLARLLDCVVADGWVLIADEPSNIDSFLAVIGAHAQNWTIVRQTRGFLFIQRA